MALSVVITVLWMFCVFYSTNPLKDNFLFSLVLLPHSGLSSPADPAVTTSLCALTEGWRTRPETAAPAKEESPGGERGERYVRHCKLSKQGLNETHPQVVKGQVEWVRSPWWVKIMEWLTWLHFYFIVMWFPTPLVYNLVAFTTLGILCACLLITKMTSCQHLDYWKHHRF